MNKIVFDARCLQDPNYSFRGVGRHSSMLVKGFNKSLFPAHELVAYTDKRLPDMPESYQKLFAHTLSCKPALQEGDVFVELSPMTHEGVDTIPFLKNDAILKAAVIYDSIPLHEPERYLAQYKEKNAYMRNLALLPLYNAFYSISEYSKSELHHFTKAATKHSYVTGAPISKALTDTAVNLPKTYTPTQTPYFLMVGGGDKRKNIDVCIQAIAHLNRQGIKPIMKFIGYNEYAEANQKHILKSLGGEPENLVFLRHISDQELAETFNGALATICPSHIEGFSLPVMESLACHTPVILSSCEAQLELVDDPECTFKSTDYRALAEIMQRFLNEPAYRASRLPIQNKRVPDFTQDAVGKAFWNGLHKAYTDMFGATKTVKAPKQKPKLAFITPFPPDHSGVADYTAKSLEAIAKVADVHVYTNAPVSFEHAWVKGPITAYPHVTGAYDQRVSIIGNSHFHAPVMDQLTRFGGACIQHDNRLSDYYNIRYGPKEFLRFAQFHLNQTFTLDDVNEWVKNPDTLPDIFFQELVQHADPLIVHSVGIQENIEKMYGAQAELLPYCPYRTFDEAQLTPSAKQQARQALRLDEDALIFVSLGGIDPVKGLIPSLEAMQILVAKGLNAQLHFVGAPHPLLPVWQAQANAMGLAKNVFFPTRRASEAIYSSFVVAADIGIQLRTFGLGGLSGAVMDCFAAGLPCITTHEIKRMTEGPDFCFGVDANLPPQQVADRVEEILGLGLHTQKLSESRSAYLAKHNFDAYAQKLLEILFKTA